MGLRQKMRCEHSGTFPVSPGASDQVPWLVGMSDQIISRNTYLPRESRHERASSTHRLESLGDRTDHDNHLTGYEPQTNDARVNE